MQREREGGGGVGFLYCWGPPLFLFDLMWMKTGGFDELIP